MFGSYYAVQGFGAAQGSILGPRRLAARPMSPDEARARAMAATIAKYQAVQAAARSGRPGAAGRLMGLSGFGATGLAFDAAGIWTDWAAGAAGDNAAGKRAAQQIQAALAQLGYTDNTNKPLVVDGSWGAKSGYAYTTFSAAQGTTTNGIYPTQDGIMKIGDLLNAGVTPGPGPSVTYHNEGGVLVPTGGTSKASMSTGLMIAGGALLAVIIGGLALAGKKKGAPAHHSSGPTAVMVANRRRRHRRARRGLFGF